MLDKTEIKTMQNIESKYYMQPMLAKIRTDIADETCQLQDIFNRLYDYLMGEMKLSYLIKYVNENL